MAARAFGSIHERIHAALYQINHSIETSVLDDYDLAGGAAPPVTGGARVLHFLGESRKQQRVSAEFALRTDHIAAASSRAVRRLVPPSVKKPSDDKDR